MFDYNYKNYINEYTRYRYYIPFKKFYIENKFKSSIMFVLMLFALNK